MTAVPTGHFQFSCIACRALLSLYGAKCLAMKKQEYKVHNCRRKSICSSDKCGKMDYKEQERMIL